MKITILCGFLGAGKTTLLQRILQGNLEKTAVLVNEFGQVGIDGALLFVSTPVDILELPNGCICCSLQHDLLEGVKEIWRRY
ncbi:putative metal chaperone YciC [Peptococcaceae bacterium CEB3]|nr:putative metal chaperone YciC [Peptococcaceae bacterium CEB3]